MSGKVQKECEETSVLSGNRKGENLVFLQGSFISCLGGFAGLCNYCVIFFALPIWGGRVWPSWQGRGRERAGQEEVLVASWDPGGVIWGLGCVTSEVEVVDHWRRLQSLCLRLSACLVSVNTDHASAALTTFRFLPSPHSLLLPGGPPATS